MRRTRMGSLDAARVRAVVRKELRDYRRKRSIVVAMAILPAIFLIQPTLSIFLARLHRLGHRPTTTSPSSSCS